MMPVRLPTQLPPCRRDTRQKASHVCHEGLHAFIGDVFPRSSTFLGLLLCEESLLLLLEQCKKLLRVLEHHLLVAPELLLEVVCREEEDGVQGRARAR